MEAKDLQMNHFFKYGFFNEIINTLNVNAICQPTCLWGFSKQISFKAQNNTLLTNRHVVAFLTPDDHDPIEVDPEVPGQFLYGFLLPG